MMLEQLGHAPRKGVGAIRSTLRSLTACGREGTGKFLHRTYQCSMVADNKMVCRHGAQTRIRRVVFEFPCTAQIIIDAIDS